METVRDQIVGRIQANGPGYAFSAKDFLDVGNFMVERSVMATQTACRHVAAQRRLAVASHPAYFAAGGAFTPAARARRLIVRATALFGL